MTRQHAYPSRRLTALSASALLILMTGASASAQVFGESTRPLPRGETAETAALRRQRDSLQKVVDQLRHEAFISPWRGLTGLEGEDAAGVPIYGIAGNTTDAAFMKEVLRANPAFASLGYDSSVRDAVDFYSTAHLRAMGGVLARYDHFLPIIRNIFSHYGVPDDLAALAIVESAVSRTAVSAAGAAGMWQFMPGTGRDYGLRQDALLDERYDLVLSTRAAARYLASLRKELGSWAYAVLAYNCGPARVRQAIIKSGRAENIWTVMTYLPKETQAYLPALLAANYVSARREELEINVRKWNEPALEVKAYVSTTLDAVAQETGVNPDFLRKMNPHLLTGDIPAEGAGVYLPAGKGPR